MHWAGSYVGTASCKGSCKANQAEIANRGTRLSDLKATVGEYQGRLNYEPVTRARDGGSDPRLYDNPRRTTTNC